MSMPQQTTTTGLNPLAGICALILPGLGHFVAGQRARGVAIAIGILGLVAGGLLIGGIDAVDSQEDTVWFWGQAPVGPVVFAIDRAHQRKFKGIDVNTAGPVRRSAQPNETLDPKGVIIPINRDVDPPVAQYTQDGKVMTITNPRPPYAKSLGRMNELGMLFVTVAGLLNLIAIIDAAFPTLRTRA